jgi:RimJ/RimL family protein N-acetyltransferase/ribosomal protein S18 acetylase RimI-like enzyme
MASALTSSGSPRVAYRQATAADVPAMGASRLTDPSAGPADSRMTAFLEGTHHPYQALEPRVAFVAVQEDTVIGYIAGHLTRRYYCDGEVQYLYVALPHRRSGIATELLRRLATWFTQRGAIKICVNVNIESPGALPFYSRHGATAINKYWVVWDDIRALCEDSTTSAVPIESRRLKLVPQTLEDVRAQIERMSATQKAELSPAWLAQLESPSVDLWTWGFAIVLRDTEAVIGTCGFKGPPDSDGMVEIAYGVTPASEGRGFATEAAEALVTFAFGSGRVRVVRAHTFSHANASARVLTKCGFRAVGEVDDPDDGLVWRWEIGRAL